MSNNNIVLSTYIFHLFILLIFFFHQDKLKNVDQENVKNVDKTKLKKEDEDIEENTKLKKPVPKKVSY